MLGFTHVNAFTEHCVDDALFIVGNGTDAGGDELVAEDDMPDA